MASAMSHKLRVQVLYRRMLKEQLNWKAQRDVWLQNALYTRMLFEENKQLKDTGDVEAALSQGKQWLDSRRHPDPYTSQTQTTHDAQRGEESLADREGTELPTTTGEIRSFIQQTSIHLSADCLDWLTLCRCVLQFPRNGVVRPSSATLLLLSSSAHTAQSHLHQQCHNETIYKEPDHPLP